MTEKGKTKIKSYSLTKATPKTYARRRLDNLVGETSIFTSGESELPPS
jgi:hypothetical protein